MIAELPVPLSSLASSLHSLDCPYSKILPTISNKPI